MQLQSSPAAPVNILFVGDSGKVTESQLFAAAAGWFALAGETDAQDEASAGRRVAR